MKPLPPTTTSQGNRKGNRKHSGQGNRKGLPLPYAICPRRPIRKG